MALLHTAWFKPPHPQPVPVPRPGQDDEQQPAAPRASTPAEIRAFFHGPGTKVLVDADH